MEWPGASFWRDLTATHPAATVIRTVRDPERWYDRIPATIVALPAEHWSGVAEGIGRQRTCGGRLRERAQCQAVCARHQQAVQATIPPARRLVFAVKEGWEPLGAVREDPVPEDEPCPRLNAAATFQDQARRERRDRAMRALAP